MRPEHLYQTVALDATPARGPRTRRVWPAAVRWVASAQLIGAVLLAALLLPLVVRNQSAMALGATLEDWIWLVGGIVPVAVYFLIQGIIQGDR